MTLCLGQWDSSESFVLFTIPLLLHQYNVFAVNVFGPN
jgi:hypothetical protein